MKRKIKLLAVCLCMSALAVSCGKRTDVGKEDAYIYCLNEDRTGLARFLLSSRKGGGGDRGGGFGGTEKTLGRD